MSDSSYTLIEHAISAAPPPYTILLERTRFRTTQIASCSERFASSMILQGAGSNAGLRTSYAEHGLGACDARSDLILHGYAVLD